MVRLDYALSSFKEGERIIASHSLVTGSLISPEAKSSTSLHLPRSLEPSSAGKIPRKAQYNYTRALTTSILEESNSLVTLVYAYY